MTQSNDICLPTALSAQVFGRPEDWEWIEPSDEDNETEALAGFTAKLEEEPLSA